MTRGTIVTLQGKVHYSRRSGCLIIICTSLVGFLRKTMTTLLTEVFSLVIERMALLEEVISKTNTTIPWANVNQLRDMNNNINRPTTNQLP